MSPNGLSLKTAAARVELTQEQQNTKKGNLGTDYAILNAPLKQQFADEQANTQEMTEQAEYAREMMNSMDGVE